ncbi:MAG: putative ABC transporter permease [Eubacteriales bacterium]|nr:putative ABC transporter permease [Eubacteriales bacterium]
MIIGELYLWFFFYSLLGWFYESFLYSIVAERRFTNRGFLLGPYCPIYGAGVLLCLMLLKDVDGMFTVFAAAGFLCCAVEYITSYSMEKIFRARWWDYSDMPFELHGRVCLYGFIVFGGGIVLVRFFIQPSLMRLTGMFDKTLMNGLSLVFFTLMGVDIALTLAGWKGLNDRLSALHDALYDKAGGGFSKLTDRFRETPVFIVVEKGHGLFVRAQHINVTFRPNELRFFRAFPGIHITTYEELIKRLRIKERLGMTPVRKNTEEPDSTEITSEDTGRQSAE